MELRNTLFVLTVLSAAPLSLISGITPITVFAVALAILSIYLLYTRYSLLGVYISIIAMIYAFTKTIYVWPIYILYVVLLPNIYSRHTISYLLVKNSEMEYQNVEFLGRNSAHLVKIYILLLIAALVNPIIIFSSLMALSALFIIIFYIYYHDLRIDKVYVEYKKKIPVGSKPKIKITLSNPINGHTFIVLGDRKYYCRTIKGRCTIEYEAKLLGVQNIPITIRISDENLLTNKEVYSGRIEFKIVPSYQTIIENIKTHKKSLSKDKLALLDYKIYIIDERLGLVKPVPIGIKPNIIPSRKILSLGEYYIEQLLARILKVLSNATAFGEGFKKSILGEYYGVREYTSGDKIKNIHWKKSLRDPMNQMVYVKEYVSSEPTGSTSIRRHKYLPVIIYDPLADNLLEFDNITNNLLNTINRLATLNPGSRTTIMFVIGGDIIVLRGNIEVLLDKLIEFFEENIPATMYNYNSISKILNPEIIESFYKYAGGNRIYSAIVIPNDGYAKQILNILTKNHIFPPRTILFIHGKPTSMKYSIVAYTLGKMGYKPVFISEDMGIE